MVTATGEVPWRRWELAVRWSSSCAHGWLQDNTRYARGVTQGSQRASIRSAQRFLGHKFSPQSMHSAVYNLRVTVYVAPNPLIYMDFSDLLSFWAIPSKPAEFALFDP